MRYAVSSDKPDKICRSHNNNNNNGQKPYPKINAAITG